MTNEATVTIADQRNALSVYGANDRNLRLIRETFGVRLIARDGTIRLYGEPGPVDAARRAVLRIEQAVVNGGLLSGERVRALVLEDVPTVLCQTRDDLPLSERMVGKLRPRSAGQAAYIKAIEDNDIVFATGPAGTGKTFLAVGMAIAAIKSGLVRRIVLVRPAVEAGEKLGFLPGDFHAKINPYLRPLYDAMGQVLSSGELARMIEKGQVEIVPLAYMRGRTLQDAFVIMDEAQNTTPNQMKMFLTRLGVRSRIVVTGDDTQIDLPASQLSGLIHARKVLAGIEGLTFIELTTQDIVRHKLVQRIVDAYANDEPPRPLREEARSSGEYSMPLSQEMSGDSNSALAPTPRQP